MKIFWSWQSDTHANTGRHFVRAALNEAIKQLRTPEDVEEPPEAARREELHVDAGRENVPGSPNLAETILAKIAISSALVADVTPVGFGLPRKKPDGTPMPPKPLMNPNVAIELGYALDKLSTYNVLMVLNTHYGDRSCLPFDLTHKAGPIEYSLAEDATREQIQTEHGKLKGNFVVALREMLKTEHGKLPAFQETENTTNIATFWQPGDVLARIEASPLGRYTGIQAEATEYYFNPYHAFYLRIIPTSALPSTLKQSTLDSVALKRPRVFTSRSHGVPTSRNKYGAIIYDCSNGSDLDVFAQLFPNGEIWAVSNNGLSRTVQGTLLIPIVPLRKAYEDTLQNLIRLMSDDLGITSPYRIELGVVGINGSKLGLGHRSLGAVSDIIHHGELRIAKILNVIDEDSISEVVQAFIDELYDKSGTTPD